MLNNNCDWSKMLTIFYEIFSTFQNARRASRIAHHASCTLNDASLHRLHFSMMQSYDVSPRRKALNKDNDECARY